jgi:hypothetical protein
MFDKNLFQSMLNMFGGNKDPTALFNMLAGSNPNAQNALKEANSFLNGFKGDPADYVRSEFEKDGFKLPF